MIKQIFSLALTAAFLFLCCFLFSCNNIENKKTEKSTNQEPVTTVIESPKNIADPLKRQEASILEFEKLDQKHGIQKGGTLFIGSSSIRKWNSLAKDMTPYHAINRGFNEATFLDLLTNYARIVMPYEPSVIVLYCGENDIAEGAKPEDVFQRFNAFVQACEFKFPKTQVIYISMKPSIARLKLWPTFQKGNDLIKALIDTKTNFKYVDSSLGLLLEEGSIDSSKFQEDGLHLNTKGYESWTQLIKPILTKMNPPQK